MKSIESLAYFLIMLLFVSSCKKDDGTGPKYECPSVYVGNSLSPGFGMGVNSSSNRTDWLTDMRGYMKMSYPSGQTWGAVFITVGGDPVPPPRPSRNFAGCNKLSVELKREGDSASIYVGIKDNTDLDDGKETKILVNCDSLWTTHEFELKDFDTADLNNLYVVCEFVFIGSQSQTVYFRNVKYLP